MQYFDCQTGKIVSDSPLMGRFATIKAVEEECPGLRIFVGENTVKAVDNGGNVEFSLFFDPDLDAQADLDAQIDEAMRMAEFGFPL